VGMQANPPVWFWILGRFRVRGSEGPATVVGWCEWLGMGSRTPFPAQHQGAHWPRGFTGCSSLVPLIGTSLDPQHADRQMTSNPRWLSERGEDDALQELYRIGNGCYLSEARTAPLRAGSRLSCRHLRTRILSFCVLIIHPLLKRRVSRM
jgi:hypothetical protein